MSSAPPVAASWYFGSKLRKSYKETMQVLSTPALFSVLCGKQGEWESLHNLHLRQMMNIFYNQYYITHAEKHKLLYFEARLRYRKSPKVNEKLSLNPCLSQFPNLKER